MRILELIVELGRNCWLNTTNIGKGCRSSLALGFVSAVLTVFVYAEPENIETKALSASQQVGSVSLVLGKAYVFRGEERAEIAKGTSITVGDHIYTESNGHVHIRFVDDALVSVRPMSSLEVERYEFDPSSPEESTVKFNLIEGVARAISGEAAKSARQRFRLNTPVAAIGVRGTDFAVSATAESTRAIVNEGSIIMAPFSSLCVSDALGPCSQNAVELAADTFQVTEMRVANVVPRVESEQSSSSIVNLQDRFRLAGQSRARVDGDSNERDAATAYLEVAASGKVREASAGPKNASAQQPLFDFTPRVPLGESDVAESQLVWGRFGTGKGASELLSVERLVAAEARNITIAASDYLLYRIEPNGARIDSNLGVVGFSLDSAQAFYNLGAAEVAMGVGSGILDVDFINNTFDTKLSLNHSLTGAINFIGKGRVADGGYLIGLEEAQSVLGAVAIDGREAGYFFEQQLGSGSISGLTLWGGR
ncbi:FecR family protein [Gammaproteobacteria bacterium]|nr:FecR family protein [Gammaproteobacteria bacterium]